MTKRAEYIFALYSGSLAEPGDRNPYAGQSLALAKLWLRGYQRMLRVRIETGPAMQRYREARASNTVTGDLYDHTSDDAARAPVDDPGDGLGS